MTTGARYWHSARLSGNGEKVVSHSAATAALATSSAQRKPSIRRWATAAMAAMYVLQAAEGLHGAVALVQHAPDHTVGRVCCYQQELGQATGNDRLCDTAEVQCVVRGRGVDRLRGKPDSRRRRPVDQTGQQLLALFRTARRRDNRRCEHGGHKRSGRGRATELLQHNDALG